MQSNCDSGIATTVLQFQASFTQQIVQSADSDHVNFDCITVTNALVKLVTKHLLRLFIVG